MSELKPSIAEFLQLPDNDDTMNQKLRELALRSLSDIIKAVGEMEKASAFWDDSNENASEMLGLVADVSWACSYLGEVEEILENYELLSDVLEDWKLHAENRLTEDEEVELDQERMVNKLKGT